MVGFSTSKSGPRQSFGLWVIELCFKLPWKKKLADVGHGGYLDLFGEWDWYARLGPGRAAAKEWDSVAIRCLSWVAAQQSKRLPGKDSEVNYLSTRPEFRRIRWYSARVKRLSTSRPESLWFDPRNENLPQILERHAAPSILLTGDLNLFLNPLAHFFLNSLPWAWEETASWLWDVTAKGITRICHSKLILQWSLHTFLKYVFQFLIKPQPLLLWDTYYQLSIKNLTLEERGY